MNDETGDAPDGGPGGSSARGDEHVGSVSEETSSERADSGTSERRRRRTDSTDRRSMTVDELPGEIREYTTDRRSLSPLVQIQWGVRLAIGAVVVGLIGTFAFATLDLNPRFGAVLTGGLLVLVLGWVVLHHRLWVYQIRADAIYLERGVVTHVRTLVPYVRIQHVDTSRGPLERLLGLSTLVVYTAGSRGADVSIPGLEPEEARDLQQRVKELAIEAEGEDAL